MTVAETVIVIVTAAETAIVTVIVAEIVTQIAIRVHAAMTPGLNPGLIPDRLTIPAADVTVSNPYVTAQPPALLLRNLPILNRLARGRFPFLLVDGRKGQ